MQDFLERAVAFVKEHRYWFIAGAVGLVILIGISAAGPSRADEPAACMNVDQALAKIAEVNGGVQPVKRLEGAAAAELAKKFGADFEASHLFIYVVGETVYLAAFVDGCFRGIAGIPLIFFIANAPDVL